MPIERAGAQLRPVKDRGDTEPSNSLLAKSFRCGGQDFAANRGVGSQFVASPRARSVTGSGGRIVGGEVVRKPLANTFWCQAVVGQVVVVCAA